jgi:hypothetical protein
MGIFRLENLRFTGHSPEHFTLVPVQKLSGRQITGELDRKNRVTEHMNANWVIPDPTMLLNSIIQPQEA